MSKKQAVDDTFGMSPPLNQAASTDDLMALIRAKQDGIGPSKSVPSGTVPNHTTPSGTAPHQTTSHGMTPELAAEKKLKPTPWEHANPKVPVGFNFRMDELLHAKAVWLCQNMPAMSQQKLYRMAVEEKIEELLKQYYKG